MELFSSFTDYEDTDVHVCINEVWQVMILEAIRQNATILKNLKIYIASKPLLKLGCQFVSIVKVQ